MFTKRVVALGLVMAVAVSFGQPMPEAEVLRLESLDLKLMQQDWGKPGVAKSAEGKPMTMAGKAYEHGVGTHATSEFNIDLKGAAQTFTATVGLDDDTAGKGSVEFKVMVDDKLVYDSGVIHGGDAPKDVKVDLKGAKALTLVVTDADDGNEYDHADWGDAAIALAAGWEAKPVAMAMPDGVAMVIAHGDAPEPAIHGAKIVGTTPGRDFVFRIPATGSGELSFAADSLPEGLALDGKTGVISGRVKNAGTYVAHLTASNALGKSTRRLTIVAGEHKLSLTPPMGWNSWNVWGLSVDQKKVEAAADAMISSGLASKGYTYINIDDGWEDQKTPRDADGNIRANEKFPSMKDLTAAVHAKGLRIGLYSSPGPLTCGKYPASWQHEVLDAKQWAAWGFDYIKYDWCSYGQLPDVKGKTDLATYRKPYEVMRDALAQADRDIVYSLCQYGMGDVWKWGADVNANLWRTTGDINDSWGSLSNIGFKQDGHEAFAGPGHWNDPDMLVVGKVGWGPRIHDTRLTHNEQITHITLWSMLSAPLLIGCDMTQMDAFTTDLLGNPEVVDIDQDELAKPAGRISTNGKTEVWARPLADGTTAVALFNRGNSEATATALWTDLKLSGKQPVRDLWLRKDLGVIDEKVEFKIPRHGARLVKIGTARADDK